MEFLSIEISLNLCTIFFKVFPKTRQNNSDAALTISNNNVTAVVPTTVAIRNTNANNNLQATGVVENAKDTSLAISENVLFKVPYRCTLNRDSLKAVSRKVVLEIDTLPKGLNLIVSKEFKDTAQLKPIMFSESMFAQHLLSTHRFELKPKISYHQNWLAFTFLGLLFTIAILRVFYQKKFSLFLNAFLSKRFSNQITREENALTQSTSVALSAVFLVSISLFFYLVNQHFHLNLMGEIGWQKFLSILLACVVFYLLKFLANKLGGYLFKAYKETDEYIFNQFLVLQILGIVLLALCILLCYSLRINKDLIIYFGFASLGIGFIIRMIKSLGIPNMNTYSTVYIFLYLCTLEILPLIIVVKLII